jgi:CheY-like chemotaxis protein
MVAQAHPSEQTGEHDSVLVVEDESVSRRALAALLTHYGYPTKAVASAEEALQVVADGTVPHFALIDLDLPGMDGMQLIDYLAEHNPTIVPVLITSASPERIGDALYAQHLLYFRKPLDVPHLLSVLAENAPVQ